MVLLCRKKIKRPLSQTPEKLQYLGIGSLYYGPRPSISIKSSHDALESPFLALYRRGYNTCRFGDHVADGTGMGAWRRFGGRWLP